MRSPSHTRRTCTTREPIGASYGSNRRHGIRPARSRRMPAAFELVPHRLPVDTAERTRILLRAVTQGRGRPCAAPGGDCNARVSAHEVLMSIGAGFRSAPLCLACLAHELDQDQTALCRHLGTWFQRRACYADAWAESTRLEGGEPSAFTAAASDDALSGTAVSRLWRDEPDDFWDAGHMGCGELVMELRLRLRDLAPQEVLQVRALDPGAREDIPAWCAMTGHALVRAEHPQYDIRRKEQ